MTDYRHTPIAEHEPGPQGSVLRDRWIDMSKYETLLEAEEKTGERALEAVDGCLDLLRFLQETTAGQRAGIEHIKQYAHSKISATAFEDGDPPGGLPEADIYRVLGIDLDRKEIEQVGFWAQSVDSIFGRGSAYYVTTRMCALARQIGLDHDETAVLFPVDLPADRGFLWLRSPLVIPDSIGVENPIDVPVRIFGWESTQVQADFLLDGSSWDDDEPQYETRSTPGIAIFAFCLGDDLRASGLRLPDNMDFVPWETTGWAFGRSYVISDEPDHGPGLKGANLVGRGAILRQQAVMRSFMAAMFGLMAQEIAVPHPYRLDRPALRRVARTAPNFGDVKIVRLRRIYDPVAELTEEEERERAAALRVWSHRWVVREHWRKQPVGPRGAGAWEWRKIERHIKGPDYLPLVEKDVVYSVER